MHALIGCRMELRCGISGRCNLPTRPTQPAPDCRLSAQHFSMRRRPSPRHTRAQHTTPQLSTPLSPSGRPPGRTCSACSSSVRNTPTHSASFSVTVGIMLVRLTTACSSSSRSSVLNHSPISNFVLIKGVRELSFIAPATHYAHADNLLALQKLCKLTTRASSFSSYVVPQECCRPVWRVDLVQRHHEVVAEGGVSNTERQAGHQTVLQEGVAQRLVLVLLQQYNSSGSTAAAVLRYAVYVQCL